MKVGRGTGPPLGWEVGPPGLRHTLSSYSVLGRGCPWGVGSIRPQGGWAEGVARAEKMAGCPGGSHCQVRE